MMTFNSIQFSSATLSSVKGNLSFFIQQKHECVCVCLNINIELKKKEWRIDFHFHNVIIDAGMGRVRGAEVKKRQISFYEMPNNVGWHSIFILNYSWCERDIFSKSVNRIIKTSHSATQQNSTHYYTIITFHVSLVLQWELVNFACYAIPRY